MHDELLPPPRTWHDGAAGAARDHAAALGLDGPLGAVAPSLAGAQGLVRAKATPTRLLLFAGEAATGRQLAALGAGTSLAAVGALHLRLPMQVVDVGTPGAPAPSGDVRRVPAAELAGGTPLPDDTVVATWRAARGTLDALGTARVVLLGAVSDGRAPPLPGGTPWTRLAGTGRRDVVALVSAALRAASRGAVVLCGGPAGHVARELAVALAPWAEPFLLPDVHVLSPVSPVTEGQDLLAAAPLVRLAAAWGQAG